MIDADEPAEVVYEGHAAGYMVLRESSPGEWLWAWQRPDGCVVYGFDADAEKAADAAAKTIGRFYDSAH